MIRFLQSYIYSFCLLFAILVGGLTGYHMGKNAEVLRPIGDAFLNLILTVIVPLVFFSVASAVAKMGRQQQVGKMLAIMLAAFVMTSTIAAFYMIIIVKLFPVASAVNLPAYGSLHVENEPILSRILHSLIVTDFSQLLSHHNMLAIIVFAFLTGMSVAVQGQKAKPFAEFLESGAHVCLQIMTYIMYLAPIGFFAYFAAMIGGLGTDILTTYYHATVVYYLASLIFFVVVYSLYCLCLGKSTLITFWKNSAVPAMTALATCSSAASMPANMHATRNMGVSTQICETVIPIGTILHKDGSVLGAILKIAFLFAIFHLSFTGASVLITAWLVALLVGSVMGAIPGGGMMGEMLILSLYGLPPEALMLIAAIGVIIDPLATVLNVMGNAICSLWVARLLPGEISLFPDIEMSGKMEGEKI